MNPSSRFIPRATLVAFLSTLALALHAAGPARGDEAGTKPAADAPPPAAPSVAAPAAPSPAAPEPGSPSASPEGSPAAGRQPPAEVQRQIEKNRADENKAMELRHAAETHPNELSYQIAYAQGAFDLGRTEEVVDVATVMVEKFPHSAELLTILGRALAREGQFEVASIQYSRAIALAPQSARIQALAAGTSFVRGDLKAAEAGYRKALSVDPKMDDARTALAIMLVREGRYRDASALYTGRAAPGGRLTLLPSFLKEPPFVLPASFRQTTVPFVTARGYPPFVRIKVDDRIEKLFVVDTGSEEILLTSGAAKEFGHPEKGEGTIKDAQGKEHVTPAYVLLDSFRIGDLVVKRIPARVTPGLAYPDLQIAGSIGRDLLRRFRVVLDYGTKSLTLARRGGEPLDGAPFDVAGVILVDGYRGDRSVGKFIVDTSSYTPGSMDIQWVARETGLTVYSKDIKPIPEGPYVFGFTMPDLRVDQALFEKFAATAVDLRQMARSVGVHVSGVIGNSLLRGCRLEIDFENQRLSLRRAAPAPPAAAPAGSSAPGAPPPPTPASDAEPGA